MFTKLFTSLLAVAPALALPATLQPRSCSTLYEPQLWTIAQHVPETPDGPFTTPFRVFQDIGKKDLVASFRSIPTGAYGCTLQFDYQPGTNALVQDNAGDVTQINVFRVSDGGNFPCKPLFFPSVKWSKADRFAVPLTWDNTDSRTGSLVGTFDFPSGADLNTAHTITINSFACSPVMTFRLSIADPGANGGVQDDEGTTSGLRMAYNC
jgi:hypothetical protein